MNNLNGRRYERIYQRFIIFPYNLVFTFEKNKIIYLLL